MPSSPSALPQHAPPYTRVVALAAVVLLLAALFFIIRPFFSPMVWAFFIAFLLQPLHRWLARRLGGRPQISALTLTILTLVLLLGPLTALSGAMAAEAAGLLQRIQGSVAGGANAHNLAQPGLKAIQPLLGWAHRTLGVSTAQIQSVTTEAAHNILQHLAALGGSFVLGAISTVINAAITVFLVFFFIRDGARIMGTVQLLTPLPADLRVRLFARLTNVIRAVIIGTGLTALIQGALVGTGFMLVGLSSPLVFGALSAVLALLPLGGTALVWGPAAVLLAARGHWGGAIFLLIWGVVLVSLMDNLVKPMLISRHAPIATVTMFIGVLGGIATFGAVGMFLGPVLLALVIALIEFSVETAEHE